MGNTDELTPREQEIMELAATTSLGNEELAIKLGVAPGTVKNFLHRIYSKVGVEGRLALILWYQGRRGSQQ